MPDLTPLRDLAPRVAPPDLDGLALVARRRRRREAVLGVGATVAALALAAAVLVPDPAGRAPEPARPDRTGPATDLERIRDTGQVVEMPTGATTLRARRIACVPPECEVEPGAPVVVVEISADDFATSELHAVRTASGGSSPHVAPYDETRVLVHDYLDREPWTRYRLLGPPGVPSVHLRYVDEAAVPGPGPGMPGVLVPTFDPLLVDDEAATIRPLDVPAGVDFWSRDTADALWGVDSGTCVVHVLGPDGTFAEHRLDCRGRSMQVPWFDSVPPEWFDARHLAVVEMRGSGVPAAVHASVDGGRSWRRIPVPEPDGDIYAEVDDVLADLQ